MLLYISAERRCTIYTSKLKKFQVDTGIPTDDLSKILGVSKQMVYYWREFGIRNWTTANKLAHKLNCKVDEIIGMANYGD